MKYVRTPGFLIDLRRLPDEHRKLFVESVHNCCAPRWTLEHIPEQCRGHGRCGSTGSASPTR
jgi:hypothetical protein